MTAKKFYIKTLGCKVNQYESQVMRENFLRHGYTEADNSNEADVCVVNTCTVTSTSDSKSLKSIRSCLGQKNRRIIVTGCMIESRDMDLSELKGVDFIIKNKDKYRIPEIIEGTPPTPLVSLGYGAGSAPDDGFGISGFKNHARAFVKVQDGCDNKCSYCKVSVVRGRSRSRPLEDVLQECRTLIKNSYREIVLTGICLGAYGRDISGAMDLSRLIRELCRIEGDWRVRLSSIEPKDITGELVSQIASGEKLCKHLHIPFQSGDDEILKRMRRPYTAADYIGIVTGLRKAVPDIAISTDIMVGFPGEKESNFQNTLDFLKKIKPMRLHVFGFSKRAGTSAYHYKGSVNIALKKQRERALLDAVEVFTREFEGMFIGKIARVLAEDRRDNQGFLQGYTDRYIKVLIDGPDSVKSGLLTCRLTSTPPMLLREESNKQAGVGLTNQKVYGILLSYSD